MTDAQQGLKAAMCQAKGVSYDRGGAAPNFSEATYLRSSVPYHIIPYQSIILTQMKLSRTKKQVQSDQQSHGLKYTTKKKCKTQTLFHRFWVV